MRTPRSSCARVGCLAVVLSVGLLTGCGGGDPADDEAAKTAASSRPASSGASTPAGTGSLDPRQFVASWIRARNASLHGDFDAFGRLASADCRYCAGFTRAVRRILEPGGRIEGGRFIGPRRVRVAASTRSVIQVDFVVDVERTLGFDDRGRQTTDLEGSTDHAFFMRIERQRSGWVVVEVGEYGQ